MDTPPGRVVRSPVCRFLISMRAGVWLVPLPYGWVNTAASRPSALTSAVKAGSSGKTVACPVPAC